MLTCFVYAWWLPILDLYVYRGIYIYGRKKVEFVDFLDKHVLDYVYLCWVCWIMMYWSLEKIKIGSWFNMWLKLWSLMKSDLLSSWVGVFYSDALLEEIKGLVDRHPDKLSVSFVEIFGFAVCDRVVLIEFMLYVYYRWRPSTVKTGAMRLMLMSWHISRIEKRLMRSQSFGF